MIRASLYLIASATIWFAEGAVFSMFLGFSRVQIVLMAVVYVILFLAALRMIIVMSRSHADFQRWRLLSLGPMIVLVVGSFVSLPIMALIAALGLVVHA